MRSTIMLPANIDACALWRLYMPHLQIAGSKFVFNPKSRLPLEVLTDRDVAIVQRLASKENHEAIIKIKELGLKVLYDLDDNLWSIPNYNPAKKVFELWRNNFPTIMNKCDLITVSTGPLRAAVLKNVKPKVPVAVIHNAIDFNMFHPLPKKERDIVKVGWAGTATHERDTAAVYDLIPEVLALNDKMRFEIVGQQIPQKLLDHPRVRVMVYVPISEYPSRIAAWRWDLFLAPLENNTFNKSKSNIKILEAAAIKTPILVSDVAPYSDFCALHKDLKYLVCDTPNKWKSRITEMVNEPERRTYYGELMYQVAKEHFDVKNMAKKWEKVIENV